MTEHDVESLRAEIARLNNELNIARGESQKTREAHDKDIGVIDRALGFFVLYGHLDEATHADFVEHCNKELTVALHKPDLFYLANVTVTVRFTAQDLKDAESVAEYVGSYLGYRGYRDEVDILDYEVGTIEQNDD